MPVSGDTFQLRNYEDSDLKKHQCKTSKYTRSLIRPTWHLMADNATEGLPILWRLCAFLRLPSDAEVEAAKDRFQSRSRSRSKQKSMLKSKPLDAEVEARCRSRRVLLAENFAVKAHRKNSAAKAPRKIAKKLSAESHVKKATRPRLREKASQKGSAAKAAPWKSSRQRLREN